MRRTSKLGLVTAGIAAAVAAVAGGCSAGTKSVPVMPTVSHTPWMLIVSGSATPVATQTFASPTPSPTTPATAAAATTSPTPLPSVTDCSLDGPNLHQINGATAVTGATTGTVTWYNPGGKDIVKYRVTAIGQDVSPGLQRDVGWTEITPPASCGWMTATVTGLDRQSHYQFSVDVVMKRDGMDGTSSATIARTRVVATQ